MPGDFVTGEVFAAPVDEGVGFELLTAFFDDEDFHHFAAAFVRGGDAGGFGDGGVFHNDFFDFVRVHIEARDDDDVFFAVDDLQAAVFAQAGDVAAAEPAVFGEGVFCVFGALPVAAHNLRAADPQFTGFVDLAFQILFVADGDVGGGHRQADAAVEVALVDRHDADQRRGFGKAVALGDGAAGDALPAFGHRLLYGHAAADGDFQPGEVQIGKAGLVHQGVEQGVDASNRGKAPATQFTHKSGHVPGVGDQYIKAAEAQQGEAVRR